MIKAKVEMTDTFSGECNYSWVKRWEFHFPDYTKDRTIVRHVKKHVGWNGLRCVSRYLGDTIELIPNGICQHLQIDLYSE